MEEFDAEQGDELGVAYMQFEILKQLLQSNPNYFEQEHDVDDGYHRDYESETHNSHDNNVSKLMAVDTDDYKIIWLHSNKTSNQANQSWIETRLRIIFPKAEIFSNNDFCLVFLESLPIESKLFILGNGNDYERFKKTVERFHTCYLFWNRSSTHTMNSFIYLQETFIKICDREDETDDLAQKEKHEQAMDNYAIMLHEKLAEKSFDDVQNRLCTVFERLVSFNDRMDCFNYIESSINIDTPIFLILFNYSDPTFPPTTRTIKAAYHMHPVAKFVQHQHFYNVEQLIIALRRDIRALTNDFPFSIIQYSVRQLDSMREPYKSFVGFMDVLISLTRDNDRPKAQKDFLTSCRAAYIDSPVQLQSIDRFAQEYQHFEQAIGWYTRDSFVYRLVNQAMRSQNPDIIHKYRFFINDLMQHLETLYEATKHNIFHDQWLVVYRGQGMHLRELNKLKRHVGKEFALNSFYSATLDRDMAIEFALVSTNGTDILSTLIVLNMDQTPIHIRPFASIEHLSVIPTEREVLISMGSVFRLESINFDEILHLWIIRLTRIEFNKDDVKTLNVDSATHEVSFTTYGNEERPLDSEDDVPPFFRAAMQDTIMVNEYVKLENNTKQTIQHETNRLKESMEDVFQIYGKRK